MPPKSGSNFAMVKIVYSDFPSIFEFSLLSVKVTIIPLGSYHTIYLSRNHAKGVIRNIFLIIADT